MRNMGFFILIIGLVMTIGAGYSYITKEKVIDLGSIEVFRSEEYNTDWLPFVGIVVMIIGAAMMTASRRKTPAA